MPTKEFYYKKPGKISSYSKNTSGITIGICSSLKSTSCTVAIAIMNSKQKCNVNVFTGQDLY